MDRRTSPRIPVRLPVTMSFHKGDRAWTETDAELVNLSDTGMLVHCDRIPPQATHVLLCMSSVSRGLCAAQGEAVRVANEGGFAVRFNHINQAMVGLINELSFLDAAGGTRAQFDVPEVQVWVD